MSAANSNARESPKNPPLNIVVLGASFAGLSVAHRFLDTTLASLGRTSAAAPSYRLVLVSPSTHIYWNLSAPRALVAPDLIADEEAFIPIEPGFRRHRASGAGAGAGAKEKEVVVLQGVACGWGVKARVVRVRVIGPRARKRAAQIEGSRLRAGSRGEDDDEVFEVPYHALIVATGSSAHSPLFSLRGPHTETLAALRENRRRVAEAESIVVAGGGPSGVETAGQLATYLNQKPGVRLPAFMTRRKGSGSRATARKRITLIMASPRALPGLPLKVGLKAERQLQGLGVRLIKDVRVVDTVDDFGEQGKTKVVLSNDQSMLTDVYIAATGLSPNTGFVPADLLDAGGYIVTNAQTLRVEAAGARVYAVGDCASYSLNYVLDAYIAVPPLMANLAKDLWAWELRDANPYGGSEQEIGARDDVILERPDKIESQLCPITRRGGVGILFQVSLPSIMVHLAKGRDYRTSKAKKVVVDGNNPY